MTALRTAERDGWVWVMVDCALCLDSAAEVRRSLDRLIEQGRIHVVIDVSRGATLDFDALVTLVMARNRLRRQGGDLVLQVPDADVNRLLELTGLTDLLDVAEEPSR